MGIFTNFKYAAGSGKKIPKDVGIIKNGGYKVKNREY
jgi:hypothetical protein